LFFKTILVFFNILHLIVINSCIKEISNALTSYKEEVEDRSFPGLEHSFQIQEENWQAFLKLVEK
jgi:hypothetical protein